MISAYIESLSSNCKNKPGKWSSLLWQNAPASPQELMCLRAHVNIELGYFYRIFKEFNFKNFIDINYLR